MANKFNGRIAQTSFLAIAGSVLISGSAMAACGPGYKPVEWQNSGNIVCVLDVDAGNNTLVAPGSVPPPTATQTNLSVKLKKQRRVRRGN